MPHKDKDKRRACTRKAMQRYREKRVNDPVFKQHRIDTANKRIRAIQLELHQLKERTGCGNCPENDPICLDFHHIDNKLKEFDISLAAAQGYALERILEETKKCKVLCANCHRKEEQKIRPRKFL